MKRLAIISTHPIQYYAPVFKLLSQQQDIKVKVFYTWGEGCLDKYDPGFGKKVEWDIPLLEGYDYQFLKNTSSKPGSAHFNGIINPDAISQIRAFNPDAILIYGWAYRSHLKIMYHFKNKVAVWFRGDSHLLNKESATLKSALRDFVLKSVYKLVDKCFYVGNANKNYFLKYGISEQNLIFAPHAIDNARFSVDRSKESEALRADLGLKETDLLILFAGKLEDVKDPELLLNAFMTINSNNVHLLFVGNGPLEKKLKDSSSANANVHFLPFQNQQAMPVIYQSCDIYCLPSKSETWGLAVNEAMACSKAILVSDKVGCAVDLVHNYENGFIFKSGDIEELKKSIGYVISSPHILKEMGRKSSFIIKDWNFEALVAAVKQEFKKYE